MAFGYKVWFTERARNRVVRWNPDTGEAVVVAGEPKDGDPAQKLSDPYGLAFDPEGCLLVADKLNGRICRLKDDRLEPLALKDMNGHRAPRPETPAGYDRSLRCPTGLFREKGNTLLCAFADDYTVYRIHADGRLELLLGMVRNRNYHFTGLVPEVPPQEVPRTPIDVPTGIVGRSDGTIFFIERIPQVLRRYHPARGLECVFPLSRQAEYRRKWDVPETVPLGDYHPACPGSLALDQDETLYVTEIQHGCVLRIDFEAKEVRTVLRTPRPEGTGRGGPAAVAFGPDGTAWVLNSVSGSVEAYRPTVQAPWTPMGPRLTAVRGEPLRLPMAGSGIVTGS